MISGVVWSLVTSDSSVLTTNSQILEEADSFSLLVVEHKIVENHCCTSPMFLTCEEYPFGKHWEGYSIYTYLMLLSHKKIVPQSFTNRFTCIPNNSVTWKKSRRLNQSLNDRLLDGAGCMEWGKFSMKWLDEQHLSWIKSS